jgi:hypothetical protein
MAAEQVLDVGEDQLLMLLLVLEAQHHPGANLVAQAALQRLEHLGVDPPPIAADLVQRRTRQQAARGARMARADGLVIGVEEVVERRFERRPLQHERLEKPGRVGEVPFGRARVRHRLHLAVLRRERFGEELRLTADLLVTTREPVHARGNI